MPKIVNKNAKKLEILHAAMKVFAKKGIVKTKMIDVAHAAGVGKGTIYEYFRSKEEIFYTAYQYMFEDTEKAILENLKSTDDPVKQLEILVDTTLTSFLNDGGDFAEIMMDFWAEGVRLKDSGTLSVIDLNKIYSEYRIIISAILNDGIHRNIFRPLNAQAMAAVMIAALDGLALQWIMDRKSIDLQESAKVMLDSFLNGIKR